MERALVQPGDVPVPLRALNAIIKDWRIYCEEHYSIFVLGEPHQCTQDTCELFSPAHQLYGCRACGNHHVCRRQVCSAEQLREAERRARSLEDLERYLGIPYGYWCPVEEYEVGVFACRISGHVVNHVQQQQPEIWHGAMLRENASYRLEQGTVVGKRAFQGRGQKRPPTSLSSGAPVMRAERTLDATALSWSTSQLLPPPTDLVDFVPQTLSEDGDDGDDGDDDESTSARSGQEKGSESEVLLLIARESRDVMSNATLMNALSRTSSPKLDRRRASDYFQALDGLMDMHISTFQGPASPASLEPPFKRPASAPLPRPNAPPPASLPALEEVSRADREALQSTLRSFVRTTVRRIHTYWESHPEIAQEARVQTYDLERTVTYCVPLMLRLLILMRRYQARLRYIQRTNAPRVHINERRGQRAGRALPQPLPGVSRLAPQTAVWVDIEQHLPELLLRGFSEPLRLRDAAFGEVHELWTPDPFLAEAASHGVLDECEARFKQSPRYLDWIRWALQVLDLTPAALHERLWARAAKDT